MARNPNDQICDSCGQPCSENEMTPLVFRIQASRAGRYSAFFDGTLLPAWLHFLFAIESQAIELCATCASEHVTVSPELIEKLADVEVAEKRVPHEKYLEPMRRRVRAEFKAHIDKAAKRLAKKEG